MRALKTSLGILALLLSAAAHQIPIGVGSRSYLQISRNGVWVRMDIGYSPLAGSDAMHSMDTDRNRVVDAEERRVWLLAQADRVKSELKLEVNGVEIPFEIRSETAQLKPVRSDGLLLGEVAPFAFDVWVELIAWCDFGDGEYALWFTDHSFPECNSRQDIMVETALIGSERFFSESFIEDAQMLGKRMELAGRETILYSNEVRLEFRFPAGDGVALPTITRPDTVAAEVFFGGDRGQEVVVGAAEADTIVAMRGIGERGLPGNERESMGMMVEAMRLFQREGWSWKLIGLCFLALIFGQLHALGPGHGKTMVAAYLIGSKGRVRDALGLGAVVTFAHTFSIFALGLAMMLLKDRYAERFAQDTFAARVQAYLEVGTALVLLFFGGFLLQARIRSALRKKGDDHDHAHGHAHGIFGHRHTALPANPQLAAALARELGKDLPHVHGRDGSAGDAHPHVHGGEPHVHAAHPHVHGDLADAYHSHEPAFQPAQEQKKPTGRRLPISSDTPPAPLQRPSSPEVDSQSPRSLRGKGQNQTPRRLVDGETDRPATGGGSVTFKEIVALGLSGGLVPCPSGLGLMLFAIAINELRFGLVLLVMFSLGLGTVLCGIGLLLVLSKAFFARLVFGKTNSSPVVTWLPSISAFLLSLVGLVTVGYAVQNATSAKMVGPATGTGIWWASLAAFFFFLVLAGRRLARR